MVLRGCGAEGLLLSLSALSLLASAHGALLTATVDVRTWSVEEGGGGGVAHAHIASWNFAFANEIGFKDNNGVILNMTQLQKLKPSMFPQTLNNIHMSLGDAGFAAVTKVGFGGLNLAISCPSLGSTLLEAKNHEVCTAGSANCDYDQFCFIQPGQTTGTCEDCHWDRYDECPDGTCESCGFDFTSQTQECQSVCEQNNRGDPPDPRFQLYTIPPLPDAVARFVKFMDEGGQSGGGPKSFKVFDENVMHDPKRLTFGNLIGQEWEQKERHRRRQSVTSSIQAMPTPTDCTLQIDSSLQSGKNYTIVEYNPSTGMWDDVTVASTTAITEKEIECSIDGVQDVVPKMNEVLTNLEAATNATAFDMGLRTITYLAITDNYFGCFSKLKKMTSLREEEVPLDGQRSCDKEYCDSNGNCGEDYADWANDPCCNDAKAFTTCCAPHQTDVMRWVLDTANPADAGCTPPSAVSGKLAAALAALEVVSNMQSHPVLGCAALREDVASDDQVNKMFEAYDQCWEIVFQTRKTKTGQDKCSQDDECYTWCNKNDERCAEPRANYEMYMVGCIIDKMDDKVRNFFRDRLKLSSQNTNEELAIEIKKEIARTDCIGESSEQGACMLDWDEATCDAHIFNNFWDVRSNFTIQTKAECDALGSTHSWSDLPLGCLPEIAAGDGMHFGCNEWWDDVRSEWRDALAPGDMVSVQEKCEYLWETDEYVCVSYDDMPLPAVVGCYSRDWEVCSDYYWDRNKNPFHCMEIHKYFQESSFQWQLRAKLPMDALFPWGFWTPTYELSTSYESASPVAQKCKLTFWPNHWNPGCNATCQCGQGVGRLEGCSSKALPTNVRRAILNVTLGATMPEHSSKYLQYKNRYEWGYDETTDKYGRFLVENGNEAYCEWEKKCNYDHGISTLAECLAAEGSHFCGECDGPYCWSRTVWPKCFTSRFTTKSICEQMQHTWVEPEYQCWHTSGTGECICHECCRKNDTLAADGKIDTAEECFGSHDIACPRMADEWDPARTWSKCDGDNICYDLTSMTRQECEGSDYPKGQWDWSFPRWQPNLTEWLSSAYDGWSVWDWETNSYARTEENWEWMFSLNPIERGVCMRGRSSQWFNEYSNTLESWGQGLENNATCVSSGYIWKEAYQFRAGEWHTQATCKACSAAPWDFQLAQDQQLCENAKGRCSASCPVCAVRNYWDDSVPKAICKITSPHYDVTNCTGNRNWISEIGWCVAPLGSAECQDAQAKQAFQCEDLTTEDKCSWEALNKNSDTNKKNANSNPNWFVYGGQYDNLLDCTWNYWAECPDKATCEAKGECDDWSYWTWDNNKVCRVPFTEANDWGGPKSPCDDWTWGSTSLTSGSVTLNNIDEAFSHWDDACLIKGPLTSNDCTSVQGTLTQKAEDFTTCETRAVGCRNKDRYMMTAIPQNQCPTSGSTDDSGCDPDIYEWENVHTWYPGHWTSAKIINYEWKARAFESINQWGEHVSGDDFRELYSDVVYTIAGQAYIAEAKCNLEPVLTIMESVACGCGTVTSGDKCDKVWNNITCPTVAEITLWKTFVDNSIRSPAATGKIGQAALEAAANTTRDSVESTMRVCPGVMFASWGENQIQRRRSLEGLPDNIWDRRSYFARQASSTGCDPSYDTVVNSNSQVIGQIVGNGAQMTGLATGTMRICIPIELSIPVCIGKYPSLAMAMAEANSPTSTVLDVTVVQDGTNKYCADIDTTNFANGRTVFPAMVTKSKTPYVAFTGNREEKSVVLNLASKELFTVKKQIAFKQSIADAIVASTTGLDASTLVDAIVIKSVCDANGCVNYVSRRSRRSSGITVIFEVQEQAGVDLSKVSTALQADNFLTALTTSMASNGLGDITPSNPTANSPGVSPTPVPTPTPTTTPPVSISAASSFGPSFGGALGPLLMLLWLAVAL